MRPETHVQVARVACRLIRAVIVTLPLIFASPAYARIEWDTDSVLVVGELPIASFAATVNRVFQVHVSPGGTVFLLWPDFNGDSTSALPPDSIRLCDGRKAFASNDSCESYDDEYCDNCTGPFPQPRACRYYYLGKYLSSTYVRAISPDGFPGPIEEVNPVDPDSLTDKGEFDAAVGPDGSLHVIWKEIIPNVPMDPAPYSNSVNFNDVLPLPGQDSMYNKCGRDADFSTQPDFAEWIVGPSDTVCIDSCGHPCNEIDTGLPTCIRPYPCWRQLAPLNVVCYRRRYPTGAWGPIHRNIAHWTDLNAPDTLRTTRTPRIAVDAEGWVYAVWSQKSPEFPSCAWRPNGIRLGRGGTQSSGRWNIGMFDCFFRKWLSTEHLNGPTEDDPVIRVTTDPVPVQMPEAPERYEAFQSDDPMDIIVVGVGDTAKVHVLTCRCPTLGKPCAGADYFADQDVYIHSTNGGATWATIRRPITKSLVELYACEDPCTVEDVALQGVEMSMARFLRNTSGPVHVLYDHEFTKPADDCEGCPYGPDCFPVQAYSVEVFHRQIGPGDPEMWSPP